MASNIFHTDKNTRKVSLKDIVEVIPGTEYFINEEVEMDDYGYPVVTAFLSNPIYNEGVYIDIFFQDYKDYETPLNSYEIHFFTEDGLHFAEEISKRLNIEYGFISGSSHSDHLCIPDDEMKERINRFNNYVDEYNLKIRGGDRPVFIPSEVDDMEYSEYNEEYILDPNASKVINYEEINGDDFPF